MAATKKLPPWLDKGADVKTLKKGAKKSEKMVSMKMGAEKFKKVSKK